MLQELLKSSRGGQLLQGETLAVAPSEHISLRAKLCLAFACFLTATLLCLVPLHSAYALEYSGSGGYFEYEDDPDNAGGIRITDIGTKDVEVVPNEIDGKPVTSLRSGTSTGKISTLDCSACQSLKTIYLPNCPAEKLIVKGCPALVSITCEDLSQGYLTSIDASGCTSLETLNCGTTDVASLNINGCTALKTLDCNNTQLASLDLSTNAALETLDLTNAWPLTKLDVTHNPKLKYLSVFQKDGYANKNGLTTLDVTKNPELETLNCAYNCLTSLDISKNPKLTTLACEMNFIADTSALEAWLAVSGHSGTVNPQNGQSSTTTPTTKVNLGQCAISGIANQTYTGSHIKPGISITYKGTQLKQGTDYTVTYANNIKVGTATVTIKGIGNYSGTEKLTFKINAKSISGATVNVSDQNYTGKALTPAPTVKFGSTILKSGTDYTLAYKNNVNAGTATITITGKGSYSGSKTVTFKIKTKEGWQKSGNRWWYKNSDGTYPKNCAKVIAGKTYRFDASGYMRTGWVKEGSSWYYHDASGAMVKGWKKLGSKWYYLDPSDGKMKTGFFTVGSSKYYANNDGVMQTGWKSISNKWYYFNTSGDMAKGWKSVSGKWYYLDPTSGVMKTGWFEEKGNKYYFISSGAMATGWQKASDSWYYFKSSGAMAKGWIKSNSKWYYLDDNGVMVTEKYQVKNDTYLLASSGVMQTGWQKEGSDWFYYNKSTGAMAKDAWVGNYWLNSDGVMAKNAWVDNGKYYVSTTGAYASNRRAKTAVTNLSGYYTVQSSLGNYRLDMSGSNTNLNGNAQIWGTNNADAQVWKFTNMGSGYYRITNGNSNLPLDVYCGNNADGTNVRQWEWNGSGAQLWKVYESKYGGYVIVNKATGKALDVAGAVGKNGTNVQIWTENDTKAQSWAIKKTTFTEKAVTSLSGQTFMFKTNVGSRYLDMSAASKANGGNAQLWGNTNSNAQVWKLEKQSGDYYRIVNVNSNKVLDVNAGNKANGTNVQQYQWNGSGAQLWKAYRSLYGGYVFVNKATGKALDVSGGVNKDGANVQIWDRNDTRAQTWHLESKKPFTSNTTSSSNKTLMNSEQYTLARQIFDSYNNYRSSKGLAKVTWDDSYANMAYNSAKGCASRGALVHNLGIPANQRGNHSDILQYTTWKGEANDLVQRWKASDGHRKMMQCTSAKKAAVGVYKASNGVWYYAIVYDWRGTNHNGY